MSRHPKVSEIVEVCAEAWGVGVGDILGPGRTRPVTVARGAVCMLSRELTIHSTLALGRMIRGRESCNSTVFTAVRRAQQRAADDPDFSAKLSECRTRLLGMVRGDA